MAGRRRTFLVECYVPGIDEPAVAEAAARARQTAARLAQGGEALAYLGAVLVAADEVVFHAFSAHDPALVEQASREAGLRHERIVESVAVDGADPGLGWRGATRARADQRRRV